MKPKRQRDSSTRAFSAPTDVRRLPKLKPPLAPSLIPSPSPSFDPPLFQLPQGSPSVTPRRLDEKEKILSRSAPTRLRRIPEMDVEPPSNRTLHSPMSSEASSYSTPTGSPTIYGLLRQPGRQDGGKVASRNSKVASSPLDSSPQMSPQGSPVDRVRNRRIGRNISSRQKVEFGLPLASLPEGRGLQPEKNNILMDESEGSEGNEKFSDLQFQMDLPMSKKEVEDKRKEPDETLDFLQNFEF
jgi:hypothetical protein